MDKRFKPGDKIRAKKGTIAYDNYKDQIIIVDTRQCDDDLGERICYIDPRTNTHNGWVAKWFELVERKNIPKTETDFLDCFKQNFKEGI